MFNKLKKRSILTAPKSQYQKRREYLLQQRQKIILQQKLLHEKKLKRKIAHDKHLQNEKKIIQISKNKKYFIINNNLSGGSYKWQKDIEKYIPLIRIYKYDIFNNILQNHNDVENIVVLINSFIRTDFTINKIIELYKKYKFKLILPIHEWFWFNVGLNYNLKYHNIYLDSDMKLSEESKKLFDICYKILCPSKFVYDILIKHYNNKKVKQRDWIDYDNYNIVPTFKINKIDKINIGVLVSISECKGGEQIQYLLDKFSSKINFFIVGLNVEKYKDNYNSFINLIKKYNIHGLLYLNKWGETWCYGLSKGLLCGLPILYNNIGSFKTRIPKNVCKYIINNNNESEFYNYNMLDNSFQKLLSYIKHNEIKINDTNPIISENPKLIESIKLNHNKIKKYAIYFPQFHRIKENDINFYENYTDIVNLNMLNVENKETPNNKILGLNNILEYDLNKNHLLIDKQISLLDTYNIDGFGMYYYWFSKNTITNKNTIMYNIHEKFLSRDLNNKKIFYIWANENWSDNPAFGNSGHIIKNEYTEENFHIQSDFLIKAFLNKNYLKISNKPVFYIHHPWFIQQDMIEKLKKILNDKCIQNGFDGIELKLNNMDKIYKNGYDFHPNYKKTNTIKMINNKKILDYKEYINNDVNSSIHSNVNTIFFDFDNRARLFKPNKLDKSTICINNTENEFIKYLQKIKNSNIDILLINAWNEWGEKMHIEPSEERGDYYLNLINNYI